LTIETFYGGLSEANRNELDLASNGAFMKLSPYKPWNLLEIIYNKGTFGCMEFIGKDDHIDCIQQFLNNGRVEYLVESSNLDDDMIVQIVKTYAEHLQVRQDWDYFEPPDARGFMMMVKRSISTRVEANPPNEPPSTPSEHIIDEEVVLDVASSQQVDGKPEGKTIAELATIYFSKNDEEQEEDEELSDHSPIPSTPNSIHTFDDHEQEPECHSKKDKFVYEASLSSNDSYYVETTDNLTEEALCLDTHLENINNDELEVELCNNNVQ
jgi:hypothetical protein